MIGIMPPGRFPARAASAALLALWASSASAQYPAYPAWSFRANTTTSGNQLTPDIASDAAGRFVVVWTSNDGSGSGIYGQRFDQRARPLGAEFRVNVVTAAAQVSPSVAAAARGGFTVVWQSDGVDGDQSGIAGRRFDAGGIPRAGEFVVNAFTTGVQSAPGVAANPAGRVVAVWESAGQDGSGAGIFARRFDAGGNATGAEFVVNTYTTGDQVRPSVAMDASGNFVVAWRSDVQDAGAPEIVARRFAADGTPLGGELRVNGTAGVAPGDAAIAPAADGAFVVVWPDTVATLPRIAGRAFDPAGVPRGPEFLIHSFTTTGSFSTTVAADATGSFVVTWDDRYGPDPGYGVRARRFEADGVPRGAEFRVNGATTADQRAPTVASDPAGNFVVAWTSNHVDLVTEDVFGQTFGGMFPSGMRVDLTARATSDGNTVFEPGETVDINPSWRTESWWGSTGSFRARLTAVTGPVGAAYTYTSNVFGYGVVGGPPGELYGCIQCPFVGVTDPPTRPLTHWDAVATEAIENADQGQRKL